MTSTGAAKMETKYKLFIIGLMALVLIGTAHATATAVASHVSIDKNSVNFILTSNETVKATLYLCSVSTCNGGTAYAIAGNDTDFIYVFSTLTPNTLYYYKFNGTAEVTNAAYNSNIGNVTTDDYKINGIARVILGFFVLILLGVAVIVYMIPMTASNRLNVKEIVTFSALATLSAYILFTFIAAILGI